MQKADHSGHRNRLREKYIENGAESLESHEIIEMLLFNAIPYRNTNDIAKNLLDRFGSFSAVMDASLEMLMEAGLTRNQAAFLKLVPDVARLYTTDKYENASKIVDLDTVGFYLADRFIGLENEEHVYLLLIDSKMKQVYSGMLTKGSFNASELSIRRIMTLALNYGAAGAILAHNHPSGLGIPSQADYEATCKIEESLNLIGVELIDHYIIADRDGISMRQSGLLG